MTAPPPRSPSGSSPSASADEGPGEVSALQDALRAAHAAVYGYTYIGARSEGGDRDRAGRFMDAHRAQRDTFREELVARKADPAPTEAAYPLPDSDDPDELRRHARSLEETAAQSALQLAGAASGSGTLRELAANALQAAVARSLEWGGDLPAFPGYPEKAAPSPSPTAAEEKEGD
ncbi:ferritin-like domain-containing protein [Nocardiopsis potens]|uniref:ferritin-like domain-containing protein n=1 Tax=Nocardiopsis potens TaxID=1246458 RepID=UPI000347D1B9|nr:ferritin-like domain-containing protein [Nocardiopsis potens]